MECVYCGEDLGEAGAYLVYQCMTYCDEECLYNEIDDARIVDLHAHKYYSDDPHIEITVTEL